MCVWFVVRHQAFRNVIIGDSQSFVGTDSDNNDDDAFVDLYNHGTHVASIVSGVAPGAIIHSVKVLDSNGNGSWSVIIRGLSWIIRRQLQNDTSNNNNRRTAVASMSLAGLPSPTLELAVKAAVDAGVSIVTSAGNFWQSDACKYSPPVLDETIAVGSVDTWDNIAEFSNIGTCVDLYAPGVGIVTADAKSVRQGRQSMVSYSGTSQSCPIVVGIVALLLETRPFREPRAIKSDLLALGTPSTDKRRGESITLANIECVGATDIFACKDELSRQEPPSMSSLSRSAIFS